MSPSLISRTVSVDVKHHVYFWAGWVCVLVDLSVGTTLSWWTCLWALHCLGGPDCGHYTVLVDPSVGTTLSMTPAARAAPRTQCETSGQQPVGNDVMFSPRSALFVAYR